MTGFWKFCKYKFSRAVKMKKILQMFDHFVGLALKSSISFSLKLRKLHGILKKNRIFVKMAKTSEITWRRQIMSWWTIVEESAKKYFKSDFRTLIVRWFWREPLTIQNYEKISLSVSPKGIMQWRWKFVLAQPAFTSSKLAIETLEQGVKYIQS